MTGLFRIDDNLLRTVTLAADARLAHVRYADDQVWQIRLGEGIEPALALQTRYGGRVGLASLVPLFLLDNRLIVDAQVYAQAPRITAFVPNYARVEASLTPALTLESDYWCMASDAVGARHTLHNDSDKDITLRLEVLGQVGMDNKPQALSILALAGGGSALSLGKLPRLEPIVLVENGTALIEGDRASAKVGANLTVPAHGQTRVRWVHAGGAELRASLLGAQWWLAEDWDVHFEALFNAAQAIPQVQSDNPQRDTLVYLSHVTMLQAFVSATDKLPHPSIVTRRDISTGYSPAGDGSDYERAWSGQSVQHAYLAALAVVTVAPELAKGLLLNYLAVQAKDGSIDARPGLGGQSAGYLAPPLLARLAWRIFRYTRDEAFIRQAFPKLLRFFRYWHAQDNDHLPQWHSEKQMGYAYFPTYGLGQAWAQNLDITKTESIDLGVYLLSEGIALGSMIRFASDTSGSEAEIQRLLEESRIALDDMWKGGKYSYRDYETRKVNKPQTLLEDARADEEHFISTPLDKPARLILRIIGGADRAPKCSARFDGVGRDGQALTETADSSQIHWFRGYGVYTTQHIFKQIDRVSSTGLSRVYKLQLASADHTRQDISALLPLASLGGITHERAAQLVKQVTDKKKFWRAHGISMTPATDPAYDSSNQHGGGGVWPFYLTLLGEGLCDYGYVKEARDMLMNLIDLQIKLYRRDGKFYEFYDADEEKGWGESAHLSGVVPLHLLRRVLSVRILSPSVVWTGDPFALDAPTTIRQHGVTVYRSAEVTRVTFPSGHTVELAPDAEWQMLTDPNPVPLRAPQPLTAPNFTAEKPSGGRVIIQVEVE